MKPQKIIGGTFGMGLPKPNLMQTDPKKGDFVKGKDEFLKQAIPEEEKPEDGFSPAAVVEQTEGGAIIRITDKDGTTEVTVTNGKDGKDGSHGADGKDGTSPVVSVATITGGYRITITDKNGTKTADLMHGKNGSDGKNGNGIKSAVLNADYTLTLTFDDGTKYTTPSIRGATGAAGSAGKDGADGVDGQRGNGILRVTSATTNASGTGPTGITIKYKIALSTVKSESGVDEVHIGDTVLRSTYLYPVAKVDTSYVYLGAYTSIKGATGTAGKDGADGYTPQKGVDYGTTEEIAEMVNRVIEQMPKYAGGVS